MYPVIFTRRTAIRLLGGTLACANRNLWALQAEPLAAESIHCVPLSNGPHGAGLYVFRAGKAKLDLLDFQAVLGLSTWGISGSGRHVFVTGSAPDQNPFSASVLCSYTLSQEGALSLLSSRNLTSSATQPEALCLSPCGRRIAVLAAKRSIFNVFEIEEDGRLGDLSFVHKALFLRRETKGCGDGNLLLAFEADGSLRCSRNGYSDEARYLLANGTLVPISRSV